MIKIYAFLIFWGFAFLLAPAQTYPELSFQKFFGSQNDETPARLIKTLDNNLLIGGTRQHPEVNSHSANIWIIKVDPSGKLIWEREIGGSGFEELRDVVATPDSGYLFCGITSSFITHPEKGGEEFGGDYFVGKLDNRGNISWIKSYGGLDVDQANGIAIGRRDFFVVAGASGSNNFDVETKKDMTNLWAVKVDFQGELKSRYSFGGDRHDWASSISACYNGDYVFAGFTNSEDIDGTQRRINGDGWILRMDRYGEVLWQRIYSGRFEDYFTRVIEDREGRIVAVGNFESEKKRKQFWFLKLTPDGKKVNEMIFGGNQEEYLNSVAETANRGYIVTGYSKYDQLENKYIKGGQDFWVIRLDYKGNVVWQNTYGGREDEIGVDVIEFSPGVFYAIGEKKNDFAVNGTIKNGKDFWLLRIEEKPCSAIDASLSFSLKDNTAYKDRAFKARAECEIADGFLWNFGDGSTTMVKDPQHTYEMSGVYEVYLTVFVNETCAKVVKAPNLIMVW